MGFSTKLGTGSILRGPLENACTHSMTPKLYCGRRDFPNELLHPPKDCSVNSSLSFTLQICRVEDINLEGFIEGSVVHFHWVRSVAVKSCGVISASGLGYTGRVGQGMFLSNGLGGGGYYNGSIIKGGVSYGNADFPCELGSGNGNYSLVGVTSGAGIIGNARSLLDKRWNPNSHLGRLSELGLAPLLWCIIFLLLMTYIQSVVMG